MKLQISKRLKTIATYVTKGAYFADIGTDHAYLATYICLQDDKAKAIATDVNKGPLQAAKQTIVKYKLEDRIDLRLGDGLDTIKNEQVSTVIIAGMGGSLIKTILSDGLKHLSSVNRLILQANIGEEFVRQWLNTNGYDILNEEILEENDKVYEIIVAEKVNKPESLTPQEIYFGPHLLKAKSEAFYKKWKRQKIKHKEIINQMKEAKAISKEKLAKFEQELAWIKEVLANE